MTPHMKSLITLSLLTITVSAQAASHRLAYSKAENVEVFVDHADGQPWCSPNLQLRFAFADTPSNDAVQRLLPKLAGLISNQCAGASQLRWHSTNSQGQRLTSGTATQASNWLAVLDTPATAPAPVVAGDPAAAPQAPTPSPAPAVTPVAAPPAAPENITAPPAAPVPAAQAHQY